MEQTSLAALKIIVVDDDQRITTFLVRALTMLGAGTVFSETEALAALSLLQASPDIDLVMCDLNMPHMDGIEFLQRLGESQFQGAIVVFSGEHVQIVRAAADVARAYNLHVIAALQKPITVSSLTDVLETFRNSTRRPAPAPAAAVSKQELQQALQQKELTVFLQPKVETRDSKVVGVEALVRWQHPSRGLIFPNSFIPLAESSGLIDALTEQVIQVTLRQGASLRTVGAGIKLAINVSVDTLSRLELPDLLSQEATANDIPPADIIVEVTESKLMGELGLSLAALTRLRLKGFQLSIDDFGTGFSSMEQLKRAPFTELKIDRQFVHGAAHDLRTRAIFEASVGLGKQLGMTIVAEGVEDEPDWEMAVALGCDQAQGYFIAKPLPLDELMQWLQNRAPHTPLA
jgi:EAL domain-containing protein (putative c-di-GMP-specific phosphodiesterase class I)